MDRVQQYLEYVKHEVDTALSTSPLLIRHYTKHLLKAQGKYIRAQLVLASALDAHDEINHDAVYVAAALEILHLASLVHDDVMDNADSRRGIPTLHKEFGRKTAVICGDYLLAVALKMMNHVTERTKYLDLDLAETLSELALGELNQHLNNGNYNLKVTEYYEIIAGKTAALFAASTYAGAAVAALDVDTLALYQELGRNIGLIFQLMDDCLDFEELKATAQKPVQSDYEQGVVTLPLIYGFMADPNSIQKAYDQQLSRADINDLVRKAEGLNKTKQEAALFYKAVAEIIAGLEATVYKKQQLLYLTDKAMRKL